MKKILCLTLALCLVLGLLSGCGSQAASATEPSSTSAAEDSAQTAAAEPAGEEPAAEEAAEAEAPADAVSSEEAEVPEEPEADDGRPFPAPAEPLTYPIADHDVTFSYCYEHMPVLNSVGFDDYSQNPTWQYAQEATGVDLTWVPLAPGSSGTTMSLWIASGDMPDITGVFSYSDGQDAAVEQDLIVTLDGQGEH